MGVWNSESGKITRKYIYKYEATNEAPLLGTHIKVYKNSLPAIWEAYICNWFWNKEATVMRQGVDGVQYWKFSETMPRMCKFDHEDK